MKAVGKALIAFKMENRSGSVFGPTQVKSLISDFGTKVFDVSLQKKIEIKIFWVYFLGNLIIHLFSHQIQHLVIQKLKNYQIVMTLS